MLYCQVQMRIGILSAQLGQEDVHENRRLIKEILLLGHKAQIINYRKTVLVTTERKQVLYQPDRKGSLKQVRVNAVIPRINEADSKSINLATMALECLMASGAYSTATPSAVRLSKDKIRSLLAIMSQGIPAPRTAAITSASSTELDLDKVLKAVEPNANHRIIIKTNIGTGGKGVMSANNRGEARAIIQGFLANSIPVLLQQFVEPSKKDFYVDLRFLVVNGKVISAMRRSSTRKDEIRANISLGGTGQLYKASEQEIAMAEAAARAVGLSVAGVDIIPSGSKRLVIEVNSSPGFAVEKYNKINLARKISQQAVVNANRKEKLAIQKLADKLKEPIKTGELGEFKRPRFKTKSDSD